MFFVIHVEKGQQSDVFFGFFESVQKVKSGSRLSLPFYYPIHKMDGWGDLTSLHACSKPANIWSILNAKPVFGES